MYQDLVSSSFFSDQLMISQTDLVTLWGETISPADQNSGVSSAEITALTMIHNFREKPSNQSLASVKFPNFLCS